MLHRPIKGLTDQQRQAQALADECNHKSSVNMSIDQLRLAIVGLNERLEQSTRHQQSLKSELLAERENHEKEISIQILMMKRSVSDSSEYLANLARHVGQTMALWQSSMASQADVDQLSNLMTTETKKMNDTHNAALAEMNAMMHRLSSEFTAKLEAFRHEILSKPSEVPALKRQLEEKIDIVSMDGTNAVLRSANCEKHLQLIEKKIEQLYLLIKRIDLNTQE